MTSRLHVALRVPFAGTFLHQTNLVSGDELAVLNEATHRGGGVDIVSGTSDNDLHDKILWENLL
jgi:hypothetical protein